jgi:hypothetical protein
MRRLFRHCRRYRLGGVVVAVLAAGAVSASALPLSTDPRLRAVGARGEPFTARAAGVDNAHIVLRWASRVRAASYSVYRNSLLLGTTRATTFTDALLWPHTRYSYTVKALNSGSEVIASGSASATTKRLPGSGFTRPFARRSFWNSPIARSPTLSPSSPALVQYLVAHATSPNVPLHQWAVSVAEAHSGDTRYRVACTTRGWKCTLHVFGSIPIPVTAWPDPSDDGHLTVYDPRVHHEWDMWRAVPAWSAAAGSSELTRGDGVIPDGVASGDAANLPLLGGLIRPEEILQGHIDHALVFGIPGVGPGPPVCPATHNTPTTSDPNGPREGQRFQLDPSVNVSALPIPVWAKTIARAIQVYGMYLRDNSGTLTVYAENPISRGYDAWANVGLRGIASAPLAGIPWADLRALAAPDVPRCKAKRSVRPSGHT